MDESPIPNVRSAVKDFQKKNGLKRQAKKKKVKLSRYTPWRHMGGEEV
jgi:hypothetical protein